jgi:hypothetical protein
VLIVDLRRGVEHIQTLGCGHLHRSLKPGRLSKSDTHNLIYMVKNPNPDNTSNPEVILQRVAVYFVLRLSYVILIVFPYMAIRSSDEYMFLYRYYVST